MFCSTNSPHLTIASGFSGAEEQLEGILKYLDENYRDKLIGKPILFDNIYIFEEITGGEFDGYFKIKDKIKIS